MKENPYSPEGVAELNRRWAAMTDKERRAYLRDLDRDDDDIVTGAMGVVVGLFVLLLLIRVLAGV